MPSSPPSPRPLEIEADAAIDHAACLELLAAWLGACGETVPRSVSWEGCEDRTSRAARVPAPVRSPGARPEGRTACRAGGGILELTLGRSVSTRIRALATSIVPGATVTGGFVRIANTSGAVRRRMRRISGSRRCSSPGCASPCRAIQSSSINSSRPKSRKPRRRSLLIAVFPSANSKLVGRRNSVAAP
jgi:hypothetical protein